MHEICKDQYGDFWIGTEDGGVDKVNLQQKTFTCFKPTSVKGSIAYHNIHGLLAIGNELWIGTFEHGLDVLDILTGKVIRHYNAGPGEHSLKSNFIVTIYQTETMKYWSVPGVGYSDSTGRKIFHGDAGIWPAHPGIDGR